MNSCDLERFISKEHTTWETIKLTLLSKDNVLINKSFNDDSVIIDSVIYLNSSKGANISLANNEFVVLLTANVYDTNAVILANGYDLTNNQANILGATPGTIFAKTLFAGAGGNSSFTFLLFRIN